LSFIFFQCLNNVDPPLYALRSTFYALCSTLLLLLLPPSHRPSVPSAFLTTDFTDTTEKATDFSFFTLYALSSKLYALSSTLYALHSSFCFSLRLIVPPFHPPFLTTDFTDTTEKATDFSFFTLYALRSPLYAHLSTLTSLRSSSSPNSRSCRVTVFRPIQVSDQSSH
jgi:hypothetical protein